MSKQITTKPFYNSPIPSDWEMIRIADYGKVYTGNTPPTNDLGNYGDEFLFVSPTDLGLEKYISNTQKIYTYPENMYRKVHFSIYMVYIMYRKLPFSEHFARNSGSTSNELLYINKQANGNTLL